MLKGTIIENSLSEKSILDKLQILETRHVGDWILHDVLVPEEMVSEISRYISDGPWYIHLWSKGGDDLIILFKNKMFRVKASDSTSFAEAISHGKSIGIPEEQLDFPIG